MALVSTRAGLTSSNIATNALSVAESTRTSGRCYAAVCKALRPLGVNLYGSAAYEARDILMRDPRFAPLTVHQVDELRRGDIIVYTKSSTHPYGHISVYEGGYEEASDHLSSVTHTQAYGGATVFRLKDEVALSTFGGPSSSPHHAEPEQPDIVEPQQSQSTDYQPEYPPVAPAQNYPTRWRASQPGYRGSNIKTAVNMVRRTYRAVTGEQLEHAVLRRCAAFIMQR